MLEFRAGAADVDAFKVLIDYAAAMPSGVWYGRPLAGDVNSGLGCDNLGVDLPKLDTGAKP